MKNEIAIIINMKRRALILIKDNEDMDNSYANISIENQYFQLLMNNNFLALLVL